MRLLPHEIVVRSSDSRQVKQHTDASGGGWGLTQECLGEDGFDYGHGLWPAEVSAKSSNYRELLTIWLGLQRLGRGGASSTWPGRAGAWRSDPGRGSEPTDEKRGFTSRHACTASSGYR